MMLFVCDKVENIVRNYENAGEEGNHDTKLP